MHVSQPSDGGVATYVADLARGQKEDGSHVVVASPEGWLSERVRNDGVEHLVWEARRSPVAGVIGEVRRLASIVEGLRPDILHLHSAKAGLVGRLLRRRPPTIYQPHAWSWNAVPGMLRPVVRLWERYAGARSGAVICVSEEERALGEAFHIPRLRVIENGVDTHRYSPQTATDRIAARSRHELADVPTVVCVAVFRFQKGQDVLVEAWPLVRKEIPDALLVLVGDGPFRPRVEERAGSGVSFTGHQDDVISWIAAADVVAVPSRWEGMSLSLLEAMACERSIVATDCPGVERVLDGGGAIVPVEDGKAFATAIVERLTDPSLVETEAAIARRRVEEGFDFRRVRDQMSETYVLVLRGQP